MGTNYYLVPKPCSTCGRPDLTRTQFNDAGILSELDAFGVHVGKYSIGYPFIWRGYTKSTELTPALGSSAEWLDFLRELPEHLQLVDEDYEVKKVELFEPFVYAKRELAVRRASIRDDPDDVLFHTFC